MTENIVFELRPIDSIKANPRNARRHPRKQIKQLATNMRTFGFTSPVLADEQGVLIAGHGRLAAAREIGLSMIPTMTLSGLSERQKRLLMLADNRISMSAGWDREVLAAELSELMIDDRDLSLSGFEPVEIDQLLIDFEASSEDPADTHPGPSEKVISKRGDLWLCGKHKILCGDARDPDDLDRLMGQDRAAMAFLDPPYNVKVSGIVGRGKIKHAEFAMASGEMGSADFREFLGVTLGNAATYSLDGAVHFACMDWRHIEDLMGVGREVYSQALNIVTWVKSNAGQGSFYRSQHEMIGVFRVGNAAHLNNIELGRHGRNRSNVWNYAGVNTFGKARLDDLAAHPTVKPVAMIADAIKDCTKRGDIVLDTFAGSGSTMAACERVGRRCRSIEYEPAYVDVAIRRWQAFAGQDATHAETGLAFDDMAASNEEAA